MKAKLFLLATALALPLAAQTDSGNYQGPGVLTQGGGPGGGVGDRSGQQVNLRFWAGINGVYDTGLQPLTTTASGNLVNTRDLYGAIASIGAYGSHGFQHSVVGLNYTGTYNYYPDAPGLDGTDQAMALSYTNQHSSRVAFNLDFSGGTTSRNTGAVANIAAASGVNPGQIFDTRTHYLDVAGSMTYTQSPQTSYTFGGGAHLTEYQLATLTSYRGYRADASMMHRVSMSTGFGAVYNYNRTSAVGNSFTVETHSMAAQYSGHYAQAWTVDIEAGASLSNIDRSVTIQLSPVLASLYGLNTISLPSHTQNIFPSGKVDIARHFQRAAAGVSYQRSVGGGNGVLLSTRNDSFNGNISYTGFRKGNIGIDGGYRTTANVGQTSNKTTWYGGGVGITYQLYRALHLSARADEGHYQLSNTYDRTTSRFSVGLNFSPGDIPLSLW